MKSLKNYICETKNNFIINKHTVSKTDPEQDEIYTEAQTQIENLLGEKLNFSGEFSRIAANVKISECYAYYNKDVNAKTLESFLKNSLPQYGIYRYRNTIEVSHNISDIGMYSERVIFKIDTKKHRIEKNTFAKQ